jgi:hypothetical protein
MGSSWRRAASAFCLVLSASALSAEVDDRPARLTPSLSGSVVRAGDLLDLAFRFPAGIEPDEWEAYLSLDGGETYPVRLTGERSPASTRLVVRAPNLPSDSARILIRAGGEDGPREADRYERDVAVTDAFRIVASFSPQQRAPWPAAGKNARRGDRVHIEWIVEEGPEPGPAAFRPEGLSQRAATTHALAESAVEATVTRAEGRADPGSSRFEKPIQAVRPQQPAKSVTAFLSANTSPLRI